MNVYVVVEERSDVFLIKRLIPPSRRPDVRFVPAISATRSSALDAAVGVRVDTGCPVILLLDARTVDEESIRYHTPDAESLLMYGGPPVRAEILLAVPELEVVLFHAPGVLERILGIEMTEEDRIEARFIPKKVLARLLERSGRFADASAMIETIDDAAARCFATHPLVQQLAALIADLRENPIPEEFRYLRTG